MMTTDAQPQLTEAARLQAVARFRVPDGSSADFFVGVASLAAQCAGLPMALVSLIGHDRIWLLGTVGLRLTGRALPRDTASDGHDDLVVGAATGVGDAATDPRTAGDRFLREHAIRCYAGVPILTPTGHQLGSVAVMDTRVGVVCEARLQLLRGLAATVMDHLETHRAAREALDDEHRARVAAQTALDDALQQFQRARHDRDDARRHRDDARSDTEDARLARVAAQSARDAAVRARNTVERERDLIEQYATVLQRTLLPPSLPEIAGLALAAHYHPASSREIGGDFYDVFALGERRWAFFIGDVEGHGAEAAAATSLIRYTLRSLALHHRDHVEVLHELNTVMLRERGTNRFCTVLYGTLEPAPDGAGHLVSVATGGHTPALLFDPATASAAVFRPDGGMLVGATADAQFEACSARLRRGQTLLVYTDGLTEARRGDNPFDERSLAAFGRERAQRGAAGLVAELAAVIPRLEPADDVAVLAIEAL